MLSILLPGQKNPWLILHQDDVCAYVNVILDQGLELSVPAVTVDLSGRHYEKDELILKFLRKLQNIVGGIISDDA